MVKSSVNSGLFDSGFYPKLSWDLSWFLQRERTILKTIEYNRARTCQGADRTNQQANKYKADKQQQKELIKQKEARNIADSTSNDQLTKEQSLLIK